jgi:hypothetical protein
VAASAVKVVLSTIAVLLNILVFSCWFIATMPMLTDRCRRDQKEKQANDISLEPQVLELQVWSFR